MIDFLFGISMRLLILTRIQYREILLEEYDVRRYSAAGM